MDRRCVVIGGGLAGMVTACRLQELGLSPLVLEKGSIEGGYNNARISGGLVHLAWAAMDDSVDALRAKLISETDGEIEPELAEVLAANSGRAVQWLVDNGVEMRPKGDVVYQRHALYPHRPGTGRQIRPEFGPDKMISALYAKFRAGEGEIELGASASALTREGEGWTVTYRRQDGSHADVSADTVVVADGGFQANQEMLDRYVGPNAGLCALRAMATGTGDGLRMLLDNGAAATGLGRVYGHMVSINALTDEQFWPYPAVDKLCMAGLLVDRGGMRYGTRANTGVELVTELARSEDPRGFAVIFDKELWETAGRDNPYNTAVPNPDLSERGGHLVQGETIEELANALGVDKELLTAAVAEHNQSGRPSITQAPFYAARVVPGITFTMGGVCVDASGAVLGTDRRPLPGLFAAGSTTGGIHGGPHGGYVGGLAVAIVFGLCCAESIASKTAPAVTGRVVGAGA